MYYFGWGPDKKYMKIEYNKSQDKTVGYDQKAFSFIC
jgi:hypothetical protein